MIHIQDGKRQNTTFTGFLEQFRSKTHKNISYGKSDRGADTTVTWIHNEGVVVAVGTQDTATKSPSSGRGSDGASVSGLARRGAQTWHGCC